MMDNRFQRRILLTLIVAALVLLVGTHGLLKARESARRSACANNLQELWIALNDFASDHAGRYPRIDDVKGNLFFEGSLVIPEYLAHTDILVCPGDSTHRRGGMFRLKKPDARARRSGPESITSESYVYLGWVVTNEEEGVAAIDAYIDLFRGGLRKSHPYPWYEDEKPDFGLLLAGQPGNEAPESETEDLASLLDGQLFVPDGKGNLGSNVIHRLTTRSEVFALPPELYGWEVTYPSRVPVVWEWPDNHSPAGGNVLYLDGHVEFVPYPYRFPMTERFIEALQKIEKRL